MVFTIFFCSKILKSRIFIPNSIHLLGHPVGTLGVGGEAPLAAREDPELVLAPGAAIPGGGLVEWLARQGLPRPPGDGGVVERPLAALGLPVVGAVVRRRAGQGGRLGIPIWATFILFIKTVRVRKSKFFPLS